MNQYTETINALTQPLDAKLVKKHPYTGFDYIEGCTAIDNANRIFGHDAWSVNVETEKMKFTSMDNASSGTQRGLVSVPVTVTVTFISEKTATGIIEVKKTDIGTCIWSGKEQIETAIKGAVTDGMKRALRMFGSQFGNDLYKKEESVVAAQQVRSYTTTKEQQTMSQHGMNQEQKAPNCDLCGSVMRMRTGPRGPFWGCGAYPTCKRIINVDDVDINGQLITGQKTTVTASEQNTPATPAQENQAQFSPEEQEMRVVMSNMNDRAPEDVKIEDVPF